MPLADTQALATTEGKGTRILLWDWTQPKQTLSNRPFFTKVLPAKPSAPAELRVSGLTPGSYRVTLRRSGSWQFVLDSLLRRQVS